MPFKTDRPESKSLEKGEIKASIKGINTKVTSRSKIQTFLNTKGNFFTCNGNTPNSEKEIQYI